MGEERPLRRRQLTAVQLIPNLLTLGSLCAGLTAIRFAAGEAIGTAVALIVVAAVLDALDGRVARYLDSETPMGAELDSLADFLSFGVAPGFVIAFWLNDGLSGFGLVWAATMIYAICCALRLARFNIGSRIPQPDGKPVYFQGIPSPAGALVALMPVYAARMEPWGFDLHPVAVSVWLVLVGGLMISRVPTMSLKSVTVYADQSTFILVAVMAVAAALVILTWTTLFVLGALYLGTVALSWRAARRGGGPR